MIFKILILILIPSFLFSCSKEINASNYETGDKLDILFLGSSYFGFNDLPSLFVNLVEENGKQISVESRIPGGLYLADHASSSATESKIKERKWDFVILQGVGRLTAYPEYYTDHPVYPALQTLKKKIVQNCENTKIVFCLPWAYEDGMTWLQGWTDTYTEMQKKIYDNTLEWSNALELVTAPVGWAWNRVLEEKDYPLHYLHRSDWNHPSQKGSYLMACVIYSTVFQDSCRDHSLANNMSAEEVQYFNKVASQIVLNNPELWNITSIEDYNENHTQIDHFWLYQNYPNPFNPITTIRYELSATGFTNLSIFNILGERVHTLISEIQTADIYEIHFDGSSLPGGNYFYQLSSGNHRISHKMILIK